MSNIGASGIRKLRRALSLSSDQLGIRVGKGGGLVRYLEKAEVSQSATIASLSELAEAMDHELVIEYRPRRSVHDQLQQAAYLKAQSIAKKTLTTMAIEGQALDALAEQRLTDSIVAKLLAKPKLIHR